MFLLRCCVALCCSCAPAAGGPRERPRGTQRLGKSLRATGMWPAGTLSWTRRRRTASLTAALPSACSRRSWRSAAMPSSAPRRRSDPRSVRVSGACVCGKCARERCARQPAGAPSPAPAPRPTGRVRGRQQPSADAQPGAALHGRRHSSDTHAHSQSAPAGRRRACRAQILAMRPSSASASSFCRWRTAMGFSWRARASGSPLSQGAKMQQICGASSSKARGGDVASGRWGGRIGPCKQAARAEVSPSRPRPWQTSS